MQKVRYDNTLGNNIRELRMKSKLTQEQVVAQLQVNNCHISRETYAKIESGIANIRVRDLIILSKIFKAPIEEFFRGIE